MKRKVHVGDTFEVRLGGKVHTFRRETDDPNPVFVCERIRVTALSNPNVLNFKPHTFGTEPEWFVQRGLVAA